MEAIVDDDDYELVSRHKWHATRKAGGDIYYAARCVRIGKYKQTKIRMHRFIVNAQDGVQVDHENGDGLDNRRSNLRITTNQQNQHNRSANKGKKFKGVIVDKRSYRARIYLHGEAFYMGPFASEDAAAKAYDAMAVEMFGPFARTNFPQASLTDLSI